MVEDRPAPDSPLFQLLESLLNHPVELTLSDGLDAIRGVLIAAGSGGVVLELDQGGLMAVRPELITSVREPAPPHPAPASPIAMPGNSEETAGEPPTVDWDSFAGSFAGSFPIKPIAGAQPEPDEPDPQVAEPHQVERLHTFPQLYLAEPIDLPTFQRPRNEDVSAG